jgi:membrane protease YdiL (CAAX protease family)
MKKEVLLKHATILATYLLLVWGLYRLFIKLPDEVEETIIKPIIWLVPVFYLLKKEKVGLSSLGITGKNLFPAIYFALGLGAFFVIESLILNFLKYGGLNFGANLGANSLATSFGLSFATAISEETVFRGYIFNRVWQALGDEWLANLLTSFVWILVHLPIYIFVQQMNLATLFVNLFITFIFGVGSAFVFARTKNVFSSIFLHVLWEWPIILFR